MKKEQKDFCKKVGITEKQFLGNDEISGYLDLRSLTSIPEGFNPTVGGSLYLRSLTSIPEGFNPTVGGSLYLRSESKYIGNYTPKLIDWQNGRYIYADGIFSEVISKKGNLYTLKQIGKEEISYLATDGKSLFAHGETPEKAKMDLRYKKMANSLKNNPINPDTIITMQYYRIITGACELGIKSWIESNIPENKRDKVMAKGLPAKELLPMLEKSGAYGFDKFKSLIKF